MNLKEARMELLKKNAHAPSSIPRSTNTSLIPSNLPRSRADINAVPNRPRLVDQLQNAEKKVMREIAIMKKCRHGQIVQLLEVIDDKLTSKIFMGPFSSHLTSRHLHLTSSLTLTSFS